MTSTRSNEEMASTVTSTQYIDLNAMLEKVAEGFRTAKMQPMCEDCKCALNMGNVTYIAILHGDLKMGIGPNFTLCRKCIYLKK